ncbi:MAG TPA: hypothetical protein VIG25_13960 [Pyrinomonadaceae bacterium]|jgi:hypothetical protein
MNARESEARRFIENEYRELVEANAAAELEDRDSDKQFLDGKWIRNLHIPENLIGLPNPVRESHDFYKNCDDWGGAVILKIKVEGRDTYVVYVTTDGDDGWVEVFDEKGGILGAARTYIELIAWGPVDQVRGYTLTQGFPEEFNERQTRTMWVKVQKAKAER